MMELLVKRSEYQYKFREVDLSTYGLPPGMPMEVLTAACGSYSNVEGGLGVA